MGNTRSERRLNVTKEHKLLKEPITTRRKTTPSKMIFVVVE
jgi:hypothetical protein